MDHEDILKFCRQHDWGRDAFIFQAEDGARIGGLREVIAAAGKTIEIGIDLPADITMIREWAGY